MTQRNGYISLHDWCAELDGDLTDESDDEEDDEGELDSSEQTRTFRPTATAPRPPETASRAPTRPTTQRATARSRAAARERDDENSSTYLNQPVQTSYTTSLFFDLLEQNYIDLEPEYQRGVVWSEQKQMNLIDSLHHNYFVPPLVFAIIDGSSVKGSEKRTCIDGKQRLTSILRFMKGEIAHKDSITHKKLWWTKRDDEHKRLLSADWKMSFKQKAILCVDYKGLTPEQEREIFQRVQLGVPLTSNERLAAINGPLADCIRDLKRWINSFPGFELYMDWNECGAKARVFQMLAQIVYLIDHSSSKKRLEPNVRRLEAWLDSKKQSPDIAKTSAAARLTMGIYCRIIAHPTYGTPITQSAHGGLSTIEFVGICLLVFKFKDMLSDCQMSHAIDLLRYDARINDKKNALATFKHVSDFVYKRVPVSKLNTDENSIVAAKMPLLQNTGKPVKTTMPMRVDASASARVKPPSSKRKREVEESDDDDDVPLSRNRKAVAPKRRKASPRPQEDDEESNDGIITSAPPSKPKSAVRAKKPTSTAATFSTTAGRTTIKRSTTKSGSNPAKALSSHTTQTVVPTVRPKPRSYTSLGSAVSSPRSGAITLPAAASSSSSVTQPMSVSAPPRLSKPLPTRKGISPVSSTSVADEKPLGGRGQSSMAGMQTSVAGPSTSFDRPSTPSDKPSTSSDRLASVREAKAAAAAVASNLASSKPLPASSKPISTVSKLVPSVSKPTSTSSIPVLTSSKPIPTSSNPISTSSKPLSTTSKAIATPPISGADPWKGTALCLQNAQRLPVYMGAQKPHLPTFKKNNALNASTSSIPASPPDDDDDGLAKIESCLVYRRPSQDQLPSPALETPHLAGSNPNPNSSTRGVNRVQSDPLSSRLSKLKIYTPNRPTVPLPPTPVSASSGGQPTLPSASGSFVRPSSANSSPHVGGVATPGFPTPVTPTIPIENKWGDATPGCWPSLPSSLPAGSISGRQRERSQHSSQHLQEQSQHPLSSQVAGQKRSRSPSTTTLTREARHFEHQHLQQGGTTVVKDPRIKQHRPNNS